MRKTLILPLIVIFYSIPTFARNFVPTLLVHGYGPLSAVNLNELKDRLLQEGMEEKDILLVDYPVKGSAESITNYIKPQLTKFFSKYSADQEFDVIGHSLGAFVGLYAPLKLGYGKRMRHYVSLAGITHGHTRSALPCFHTSSKCGPLMSVLAPAYNGFVTNFMNLYSEEIRKIKKCALYSFDDGILLEPQDSGKFSDGVNIEVPGAGHMQFIHSRAIFELIKDKCLTY